jgi:TetR/AcrR family transcriptional repressor of nem operon
MKRSVRDRIVEAASQCFHALGFNACGVQEIVDRAGVPKGSFYNYFKSKELLAIEVLTAYAAGSKREMLSDSSIPPVRRLQAHFEFLASRYAGFGYGKGCLIGNIAAETSDDMPLVRKTLARGLDAWTKSVADVIRDGQANGSIAVHLNADEVARFLINSWEGAVIRMKITNSGQPLDDFFSVAFPLFTRSDKSKTSPPELDSSAPAPRGKRAAHRSAKRQTD